MERRNGALSLKQKQYFLVFNFKYNHLLGYTAHLFSISHPPDILQILVVNSLCCKINSINLQRMYPQWRYRLKHADVYHSLEYNFINTILHVMTSTHKTYNVQSIVLVKTNLSGINRINYANDKTLFIFIFVWIAKCLHYSRIFYMFFFIITHQYELLLLNITKSIW